MTQPTPPHLQSVPREGQSEERVSFARLALWGLLAVILIAGLLLFFRYANSIEPILGGGGTPTL